MPLLSLTQIRPKNQAFTKYKRLKYFQQKPKLEVFFEQLSKKPLQK